MCGSSSITSICCRLDRWTTRCRRTQQIRNKSKQGSCRQQTPSRHPLLVDSSGLRTRRRLEGLSSSGCVICCRRCSELLRRTPSTNPEVDNVSQCRQRRPEPQPRWTCTKNLVKIVLWFRRYPRGQTDRHGHHNTPLPYRAE